MSRWIASTAVVLATAFSFAPARAAQPQEGAPGTVRGSTSLYGLTTGSGYAVVDAGTQAPDFSFESGQGWSQLRDVRAQGHVLLLIGADEPQLADLERQRPRLLSMGVVPVVVLDRRPNACRALVQHMGLGFLVVSDARRVIGAQFNALDPFSRADAAAWFVIDRQGCVRDLAHDEWPTRAWADVCADALGLPESDSPVPASHY